MITLNHDDLSEDLAYLVENDVILEAINRTLTSPPENVRLKYGCKVKKITLDQKEHDTSDQSPWAQVQLEDGQTIETRLLVRIRQILVKKKNRNS